MGIFCCREEEIDYENVDVELSHFYLLRSVGKGAFGKVRIVQHKRDKRMYALKYINKSKCIKMKAVENIIQERRLLEEVNHPFICNLRFAFQDDENMFMVLDIMLGGDLRFHLDRRQDGIPEEWVRFYSAEIASALTYLHSKRIVHRDLKPDNILLDELGHAHLTDFNIAVRYNESKPLTAVAGSMAYMAPEVLRKKGYFDSVDWWSLGVVCFELLFGKRPYRGKTNNALTDSILHDDLRFPSSAESKVSPSCLSALRGYITRDAHLRLGCGVDGMERIKRHAWYEALDWNLLEQKAISPPFTPDSKHANFDATHELEELLLEDNPLKAKKRTKLKVGQSLSDLTKEERAMEERFTVFDYSKVDLIKRRKSEMVVPNNSNSAIGKKGAGNNDLMLVPVGPGSGSELDQEESYQDLEAIQRITTAEDYLASQSMEVASHGNVEEEKSPIPTAATSGAATTATAPSIAP